MIDGLKVHLSTYVYHNKSVDGIFEYAADPDSDWNGSMWRACVIYRPSCQGPVNIEHPGWSHTPTPDALIEAKTEPPPEVLAAYHAHKDELLALIIAARMKG